MSACARPAAVDSQVCSGDMSGGVNYIYKYDGGWVRRKKVRFG